MSVHSTHKSSRRGVVAVLFLFLLIPLLGLLALAVDYGYLLYVRTDLQRTADQAALAAVRDLIPEADGSQNLAAVHATIDEYVDANVPGLLVNTSDIVIGRYDPATIYNSVDILNTGVFDTVQLTLRRDDLANASVSLFFARLLGVDQQGIAVTATAVLQKARYLHDGADILPFSIPQAVWDAKAPGDEFSIYGDGRMFDQNGSQIPGNWGTLDIGNSSNSASELVDQINNGLRQEDLDALHSDGTITTNEQIDSQSDMWLNGDTGLSAGLKSAVQDAHGDTKLVPIFDTTNAAPGGNMDMHIVGWGVVKVVDSYWKGNKKSWLDIQKTYLYDGDLRANLRLDETGDIIENAFTAPVLVE
ncbi:MAG: pilus assembly protein TadG-related protein [Pirellulaceae bacterium]